MKRLLITALLLCPLASQGWADVNVRAQAFGEQSVANRFYQLDVNHDGSITHEEAEFFHLKAFKKRFGDNSLHATKPLQYARYNAAEFFKQSDANNDGTVSSREFGVYYDNLLMPRDAAPSNNNGDRPKKDIFDYTQPSPVENQAPTRPEKEAFQPHSNNQTTTDSWMLLS